MQFMLPWECFLWIFWCAEGALACTSSKCVYATIFSGGKSYYRRRATIFQLRKWHTYIFSNLKLHKVPGPGDNVDVNSINTFVIVLQPLMCPFGAMYARCTKFSTHSQTTQSHYKISTPGITGTAVLQTPHSSEPPHRFIDLHYCNSDS